MDKLMLIEKAFEARKNSYAPYSKYYVGAALLAGDSDIYTGCNVENASYGLANCAERTAIFKAISMGERDFKAIAIAGGSEEGNVVSDYAFPCGACRQVMREFVDPARFIIIVARSVSDYREYTLLELFPESFGPDNLGK